MEATLIHPEDIKAQLRKKYRNLRTFERELGLPERSAYDALRGRPSQKTFEAIADAIGVEVTVVVQSIKFACPEAPINRIKSEKSDLHRLNVGVE